MSVLSAAAAASSPFAPARSPPSLAAPSSPPSLAPIAVPIPGAMIVPTTAAVNASTGRTYFGIFSLNSLSVRRLNALSMPSNSFLRNLPDGSVVLVGWLPT